MQETKTKKRIIACIDYLSRRLFGSTSEINSPGGVDMKKEDLVYELMTKMYAEMQKSFNDVNDKIQSANNDIQTIKGEVQTIKGEVQTVKGEVQTVKGDIQTIKGEVQIVKGEVQTIKGDIQTIKGEVQTIKDTVIKIEADHGAKLGALFDGYKLNSEKLDRLEIGQLEHGEKLGIMERVLTKHDSVIKSVK